MRDTMTNRKRRITCRDDLASKVKLAPLPETRRVPHDHQHAETAPARDVVTPPRRPRRRPHVLVVALREMLAEVGR
ncbi:hypothetical protein DFO80_11172 [Rhodobacter sp. 140A]|nr:hypothetical protein DFO80_11172 [Rhodobacter sp. 140A]